MHIPAFTNQVGAYNQYAWQDWHVVNNLYGNVANSGGNQYTSKHSSKSPTIKSNGISPTDYTRIVREVEELRNYRVRERGFWYEGSYVHTDKTSDWTFIASYYAPLSYFPPVDHLVDDVRNESNVKARTKWHETRLQLGPDLAELKSTQSMIASNAIAFAKALQAARRKQWNLIPGILGMSKANVLYGKYPANRFLEYIYGWKPLVDSMYDAQEYMKQKSETAKAVLKATGRSRRTYEHVWEGGGGAAKHSVVALVKSQTEYLCSLERPKAFRLAGLGLSNPALIVWELVPFSFVIDWFIPIGNVLDAYSYNPALEFVEGFRSWSIEWTHTLTYSPPGWSWYDVNRREGGDSVTLQSGRLKERSREFYRQRLTGLEPPRLYAAKNPLSSQHIANASALVRSLL